MKYKTHLGIIIVSLLLLTVLLNPFRVSFLSFLSIGWGINWNTLTNYDIALIVLLEIVILLFIYLILGIINLSLSNNSYRDLVGIQENQIDFI